MLKNKEEGDNPWYKMSREALDTTQQPLNYIGHCCKPKIGIENFTRSHINSRGTSQRDKLL